MFSLSSYSIAKKLKKVLRKNLQNLEFALISEMSKPAEAIQVVKLASLKIPNQKITSKIQKFYLLFLSVVFLSNATGSAQENGKNQGKVG